MAYKNASPAVGAYVTGVELGGMADAELATLRELLVDRGVLFIRDQSLTHDALETLGRRFGELYVHPAAPSPEGHPDLLELYSDRHSQVPGTDEWHADVTCDLEPPAISILYMQETPEVGGDTLFASMYAAYRALSEPVRRFLDPMLAVHSSAHVFNADGYLKESEGASLPENEHPVVTRHPESGRPVLYVNEGFTTRLLGVTSTESAALLDMLFRHIDSPEFACRFTWERGSTAIWDNRCVQHRAIKDHWPHTRHGVRVTVRGSRPQAHASTGQVRA